jgi:hypothetical protein
MRIRLLRGALLLLGGLFLVRAEAQVQASILLGGGYFMSEPKTGYAHEERLCPELGVAIGTKAGRSRLGLVVIHSTRNITDRAESATFFSTLLEEEQETRSVTAELYALFPLTRKAEHVAFLAGPAFDLVFPYRTDVQRSFTDMPEQDETDAFVDYRPPGLRAGLRFRAEWLLDPLWTPFGEVGAGFTLKQSFIESSDHFNSFAPVTPPTDRMDYHLWLGVSIAVGRPDCNCPAFH